MTQNDKNLLLKDICARLPYGVKIQSTDEDIVTLTGIILPNHYSTINGVYSFHCYSMKPYLFPLSSMTEEQKQEYYKTFSLSGDISGSVDFYNKNHLDWRGLIPMGLAIDATGLNIY